MNRWQQCVREFHHQVVDQPTSPAEPALRNQELRARLILEEATETVVALLGSERASLLLEEMMRAQIRPLGHPPTEPNLVEVVDGLCDQIYVVLGTAEDVGVDLDPFFEEVHRSNMDKRGKQVGAVPVGKAIKPPGWRPPDIAGLLSAVQEHGTHGRGTPLNDCPCLTTQLQADCARIECAYCANAEAV